MEFGFWASSGNDWDEIHRRATAAERTGWDRLWVPDHFMPPEGGYSDDASGDAELGAVHEAWTLVAGLAATIPRVRIGTMVSGNTYRHPAVLAKQAVTADHISGGRVVLGLGAGWQENEHRRYGLDYGTAGDRADRLDEACAMITSLLAAERTDHRGRHYRLDGAPLMPKPAQPRLPLMIGGKGPRRTLPTVARFADEWNGWCTAADMRSFNRRLDELLAAEGRDPTSLRRSASVLLFLCETDADAARINEIPADRPRLVGTPEQLCEQVADYAAAGTDELVIPDFNLPPDRAIDTIEQFAAEVIVQS